MNASPPVALLRAVARSLCAAAGLAPVLASAQLLINPVVVELGARQRSVPITLSLDAGAPRGVVIQTELLRWTQDRDGTSAHAPTDELVVVPPIVELQPGQSQLLRVALRGESRQPVEQAFRLILDDATPPAAATPDAPPALAFRMRYDLPVMVAPVQAARQQLRWSACPAPAAQLCVQLANDGNRRISLRTLRVQGAGWSVPLEQPGVVLAQAEREWRLARPAGAAGPALKVTAETSRAEAVGGDLAPP